MPRVLISKADHKDQVIESIKTQSAFGYAVRMAGIYFFIGSLWIFFSDELMHAISSDQASLMTISIIKGWFYVTVTAALCFFMMYSSVKKVLASGEETRKANQYLASANAVLTAVFESPHEIDIYALDQTYHYLSFNTNHKIKMKEIYGCEIAIGDDYFKNGCAELNLLEAKEHFDRALAGESLVSEVTTNESEENKLYYRNYYAPIKTDDGIIGLTCFQLNVTPLKRAEDRSVYIANHDERTGLYNRDYFEKELPHIDIADNLPISVIIGDFNGLKRVNDTLGHQVGDKILKFSAEAIKKICRTGDIIARWGGDEFLILLPKTGIIEAGSIVNRIKDECGRLELNSVQIDFSFGWDTKDRPDTNITNVINNAEEFLYRYKIVDSRSMRNDSIKSIMSALHEKNPREAAHSNRVGQLCRLLGEAAGLSSIDLNTINTIGFLHDIGKVAIEENVLNKSEKLSEREMLSIKKHPEIGYRILMSSYGIPDIAEAVLFHHERYDGAGYPKGIKGDNIPFISRIVAIADSYDAMTSERPYKNKLSPDIAAEEILRNAGRQFDPELSRIFVDRVFTQIS